MALHPRSEIIVISWLLLACAYLSWNFEFALDLSNLITAAIFLACLTLGVQWHMICRSHLDFSFQKV